jgi:hypothetical protein
MAAPSFGIQTLASGWFEGEPCFRNHDGNFKKSGNTSTSNAHTISIQPRIGSHHLGLCGAVLSTCELPRSPKTRRRLSGWSSKTRMRCIIVPLVFGVCRRLAPLMTKIFLAPMLAKCGGTDAREGGLFLFMTHARTDCLVSAMARMQGFLVPLSKPSFLPHSRDPNEQCLP